MRIGPGDTGAALLGAARGEGLRLGLECAPGGAWLQATSRAEHIQKHRMRLLVHDVYRGRARLRAEKKCSCGAGW